MGNKPDEVEGMAGEADEASSPENRRLRNLRTIERIFCVVIIICALLMMVSTFLPWRTNVAGQTRNAIFSDYQNLKGKAMADAVDADPRWQEYTTTSGWSINEHKYPWTDHFYDEQVLAPWGIIAVSALVILIASLLFYSHSAILSLFLLPLWGFLFAMMSRNITSMGGLENRWNRGWGPGWGLYFALYVCIAAFVLSLAVFIIRMFERKEGQESQKALTLPFSYKAQPTLSVSNQKAEWASIPSRKPDEAKGITAGRSPMEGYWLFGIPGCLLTIMFGALLYVAYCFEGGTLLLVAAAGTTALGFVAIWLAVLLALNDFKTGPKPSNVRFFSFWISLGVAFIVFTLSAANRSFTFLTLLFFAVWPIVSLVLLVFGMLEIRLAVTANKKLALILGSVLLVILVSATSIIYLDDNLKVEYKHCKKNLVFLDWVLDTYAASHNGTYPASFEELSGMYFKEVPDNNPYGCTYYIDTSTDPPHAACSEGHTY